MSPDYQVKTRWSARGIFIYQSEPSHFHWGSTMLTEELVFWQPMRKSYPHMPVLLPDICKPVLGDT